MPTTYLWAVSSDGKVYLLSSVGQQWQEMFSSGVNFKRVSAVQRCAWAVGGDHQIYVYVFASEVLVRVKEITYENQRWHITKGFGNHLLFTDRPAWSSEDGLIDRHKDKIQLPTSSWEWESDWTIEDNLDGEPLGEEGWMYAMDFPMTYGKDKKFTSCVRRRKWFRYRWFAAVNKWIVIPGVCDDPFMEPFIDISIGGLDLPGGDNETLAVWAVTVQGRVMFRHAVSYDQPEGDGWIQVPTPQGTEISNVSVGPTGLVWVVTWDGRAMVRSGVTRQKLTGNQWLEVEPPAGDCPFLQVSVGTNVVWAISRDERVWFRKAIRGNESGTNDDLARGTGWVEMVGKMKIITVGPNDQVWAVSQDEPNAIYFRTGITHTDTSGKTWKPISLPISSVPIFIRAQMNRMRSGSYRSNSEKELSQENEKLVSMDERSDGSTEPNNFRMHTVVRVASSASSSETSSPGPNRVSTLLQDSAVGTDDEYFSESELDFVWTWLSGSACYVDPLQTLNWFRSGVNSAWMAYSEPWKKEITEKLSFRNDREMEKFKTFEQAVEKKSWIKLGQCHLWSDNYRWVESKMELEQTVAERSTEGVLSFLHNNNITKVGLHDVTCVVCNTDRLKPILTIHTGQRTANNNPLRLAYSSDTELEEWIAILSSACCEVREINSAPVPTAIWATTSRGDIFAHNPSSDVGSMCEMYWRQFGGHLKLVETCSAGVVWGIGYNHVPRVYTGGWGGGLFQGYASSSFGIHSMSDTRQMYIYENQRWNPVMGFFPRGLPTDRYMWSDSTGRIECTRENTRLPSIHWHWTMDWTIDYHTPGGVDREGWQYAKDFPRTYHSHKGLTDYVRRRRWYRKCKLTTSGPWEALESVPLLELSFEVDCPSDEKSTINLWAIDRQGNALYRHGITKLNPQGTHWEHVAGDNPFCSISVGGKNRVWAVAQDGSAFLRNGISTQNPIGDVWFHVEPPEKGTSLRQVSAGATSVWAVDNDGGLWFRQEVMPMFPEGTSWKFVCTDMRKVCVGPTDQVWGIAKSINTPTGMLSGVVCRRQTVTRDNPIGTGWEYGIGGSWNHVCIRGLTGDSRNENSSAKP